MVVTVAGLRAILAGYLMQAVLRNLGEGPAKRWAVKNAENRSPYLLPHIFLPDQASANGCDGNIAESDLGRISDAGGLQELGGRAGKKMGGKKCREQKSPSFTAHFFAGSDIGGWLCR